jgi:hypothetical protein
MGSHDWVHGYTSSSLDRMASCRRRHPPFEERKTLATPRLRATPADFVFGASTPPAVWQTLQLHCNI